MRLSDFYLVADLDELCCIYECTDVFEEGIMKCIFSGTLTNLDFVSHNLESYKVEKISIDGGALSLLVSRARS